MRRVFSALFLFSGLCYSQTGPAGVGNSSNNVLWLKADAGTSSTVNAAPLSAWNDQSGNGIDVTQTVSAQQPSFATNILNGFPAIQFDNVNGANVNDKLIGPDSPLLDNTSGYSFFMVTRPQVVDNNARVIVSKRTAVSVNQSFMQFFFTGGRFYTDIQSNNDRYNTATTFSANSNYIIDQFYNGTVASASRCRTYVNSALDVTASETSSIVTDNVSPLVVGSTDASDPRPYGGYIAEVIIYRSALNEASRIIVDNYLSAKYNIGLSANDKYSGDDAANGNFDLEVCGVGQESSGSSTSFSSSVSGGLGLNVNSGLDNGDYILAGHNTFTNDATYSDVGGMTGSLNARWVRIWYLDISNVSTVINADLEFDISDGGVSGVMPGSASNYVLLYRSSNSGNWTELTTATSVSGDKIQFASLALTSDGYYTIGTRQFNASPLPVELVSFEAALCPKGVCLQWVTASERNSAYFVLERSTDGSEFGFLKQIPAAGNSATWVSYFEADSTPFTGTSYYRLNQFDRDGHLELSVLQSIVYQQETGFRIVPNPNTGHFEIHFTPKAGEKLLVEIRDAGGRVFFSKLWNGQEDRHTIEVDLGNKVPPGVYVLKAISGQKIYSARLLIRE